MTAYNLSMAIRLDWSITEEVLMKPLIEYKRASVSVMGAFGTPSQLCESYG